MTVGEIAELLGVSRSTVVRIRSGGRPLFCHEVVILADELGIAWAAAAKDPLRCMEDLLKLDSQHLAHVV